MAPKEHKISKQAAAVLTRDITLIIPETLEIIRKPGVLQARMSLWQHRVWSADHLRYKETQEKSYM
jgi:hypothetical protein